MCIELAKSAFSVGRGLFDSYPFDAAWLWPNLDRGLGRLFVDREEGATCGAFLAEKGIGFVAGDSRCEAAGELAELIKKTLRAMLFVSVPDEGWMEALERRRPWGFTRLRRISCRNFDAGRARERVKEARRGVEIVRVDDALAEQAMEFDPGVPMIYPTREDFCRRGVAFGAVHEGRLVSMAWTGYEPHRHVLIGVRTAEEHQGKGLAAMCGARLGLWCVEQGLEPHWNAHAVNAASIAAAKRAGFREQVEHWWMVG